MVTNGSLRVVFFGTPEFAVPTLEALLSSSHTVVGVVTRADKPRGRGHKTGEPPVKSRAAAARLPVLQPDHLQDGEFLRALAALAADVGVVAAYGKILTDAVLATPRLGMINVHASLLPRYRGAAPVHRAVIDGERETGVTIMRMIKALDAGPMLAALRRPIGPDETSEEIEHDLARLGAPLLVATVDALAAGSIVERPQDDSMATYAPRLTRDEGAIDWATPAVAIHNRIRGLRPWPHAFTYHRGHRLILLRSTITPGTPGTPDTPGTPGPSTTPGTILEAQADHLQVATGSQVIAITGIQPEGKRPMSAREFLSGHRMAAGDVLTARP